MSAAARIQYIYGIFYAAAAAVVDALKTMHCLQHSFVNIHQVSSVVATQYPNTLLFPDDETYNAATDNTIYSSSTVTELV